jgi:hypothetical protein
VFQSANNLPLLSSPAAAAVWPEGVIISSTRCRNAETDRERKREKRGKERRNGDKSAKETRGKAEGERGSREEAKK